MPTLALPDSLELQLVPQCERWVYRPRSRGGEGLCTRPACCVATTPAFAGVAPYQVTAWSVWKFCRRHQLELERSPFGVWLTLNFQERQTVAASTWLSRPANPAELSTLGLPGDAECFVRGSEMGTGQLYAFRFGRPALGWVLMVMYVDNQMAFGAGGRSPTHNELLDAKRALLPPDVTMGLMFWPEDHKEGKMYDRLNLTLYQVSGASASGLILPAAATH